MTATAERAKNAQITIKDVTAELVALDDLTVSELHTKWLELFGEASRSRNKKYLIKRIAYRLQELAEGGLNAESLGRIDELAATTPVRQRASRKSKAVAPESAPTLDVAPDAKPRDPRLPPVGSPLTREHKGTTHEVTVLDDGFEYAGERFRSLSAIAKRITGTSWNGWLFFGLANRGGKGKVR